MADLLATNGISHYIENIIRDSRSKLYLISPYLKLTNNLQQRLRDTDRRGVEIILIYGKEQLSNEQKEELASFKNLNLFFLQNLHAKCYANEEEMVITSMNLYEYSEKTNREMGVLIKRQSDHSMYEDAFKEIEFLLRSATKDNHVKKVLKNISANSNEFHDGYCIRCGTTIKYNPIYSLCSECFQVWNFWENPNWLEKYCHSCGNEASTSKEKPFCQSCYSTNNSF